MDIKSLVTKLIKRYNTNDPYEIASYLNFYVYNFNFKNRETKGMFVRDRENSFIFVSRDLDPSEKKVAVAHELGHGLCHGKANFYYIRDFTFFAVDKYELEANIFAAELLIKDEDILSLANELDGCTFDYVSSVLCVPRPLVELKFSNFLKEQINSWRDSECQSRLLHPKR